MYMPWQLVANRTWNISTYECWAMKPISAQRKLLNQGGRTVFNSKLLLAAIKKSNYNLLHNDFTTSFVR
jgi:hypothetical protein